MSSLRWRVRLSWLLFAALLLPVLAACGGGAPTTEPGAASPLTEGPAEEGGEAPTTDEGTAASPSPAAEGEAPPSPADEEAAAGDKILRIHQNVYPDIFDPQKSSFTNEIAILVMNYEGLTRLDAEQNAVPAAAESWEFNEAGDQVTFTLREGLTYSDGSPLTSENFQYAVVRNCDPKTAGEYQSILFEIVGCQEFAETDPADTEAYEAARNKLLEEGVQTPDERTIVFNLTNPAPYFPYIAGLWVMFPVKQELVEEGGEDWWQSAEYHVGNGPFRITDIQEDQLISFEANENYWNGRPKLDGAEYVYIADSAVALEAYQSGQLDIMVPDPSQLPAINGDPTLSEQLLKFPAAWTTAMQFNLTMEPFQDQKVREAFAYAFDRQTYCEVINNGDCIPTLSWIPEGVPGAIETDKFGFDPEAARQALAESSYGGPEGLPEIKYTYASDDPANQPRAEWIAGQFRDILGVDITLEPMEAKTIVANKKSVETYPQMVTGGWIQDYPDPQNWLSVFWKCGTFAERWGYCNPEFDEIVNQADVELDQEKRIQLYQQAGELLVDEQPHNFLFNPAWTYLVKPEVTGYETTPSDSEWPGEFASPLTIDIER